MKICMFVKNSFEYDARVTKEAKSLIAAGHSVLVVALFSPGVTPLEETTPTGIDVIRVPRSSFGVPTLNRLARKYAGSIEARHVRLTGEAYNEATVAELGRLSDPSTVAPTSLADADMPNPVDPPSSTSTIGRAWGAMTTPVLRMAARMARWGFTMAKRLLGNQSQKLKQRAINKRMIEIGLDSGADVFHCHDLNTLEVGVRCKERTGNPLVYDSHELQTERNRMSPEAKQNAIDEEGSLLGFVDALIVASPSWVPWIRNLYGVLPDPTITVLNVPEPTVIDSSLDLRTELHIDNTQSIVIYQGSIQENRGIEPAIDAVRTLENVVLVVVGYGYHRPALEALVREEELGDKVRFFGPVPNNELISYSASADIGLSNIVNSSVSYYTSLPNKLFEYVMAGIPVVGSDSPEIGRIVSEESIGEVSDPQDAAALAVAIRTILGNEEEYRPGLAHAAKRYNWTVEEQGLLDLYAAIENDVVDRTI